MKKPEAQRDQASCPSLYNSQEAESALGIQWLWLHNPSLSQLCLPTFLLVTRKSQAKNYWAKVEYAAVPSVIQWLWSSLKKKKNVPKHRESFLFRKWRQGFYLDFYTDGLCDAVQITLSLWASISPEHYDVNLARGLGRHSAIPKWLKKCKGGASQALAPHPHFIGGKYLAQHG